MEDEEYKKLPVEERCVHKLWKARVNGYEEVTKLFKQIDDEKSPEFSKYLGLVKKFVIDPNAMGQEKGLEATLAYVESYAHAGKTVSEVMSGIVTKCIAAPKTRTRELALQVTLMYIEIEKHDLVEEELVKGMDQKNPKIVAACVNAVTIALREFGTKIINVKPLVKKITALFSDRDKAVRDEARMLVIEMFRWMGAALRPQLNNLQPLQITELEAEFSKLEGQKASPIRYVRSQQQKQAKLAAEATEVDGEEECEEDDEPQAIDPYDLADPVDILAKLPKDFYEKIEAKKWQERKEVLEILETLTKTPKLENGDYGDLVRALKKVVQKDSNVVCVAAGARCIAFLAIGLKKRFHNYSSFCVGPLLEKFKEKKQNVVTAIRDAIDAVYLTTNLEAILEDVLEALNNKNPSVKSETALFLSRAFSKTSPAVLNKKLLKSLVTVLIKNINEPDPTVRDSTAESLGTLMKLVGEKAIGPFLIDLEKDNLKMAKIRECCEKAVITLPAGTKKERPTTAPAKAVTKPKVVEPSKSAPSTARTAAKKPTAPLRKKASEVSSGSATVVRSKGKPGSKGPSKPVEKELNDDEVEQIVGEFLSANITAELNSANWKARLAAVEQFMSEIQATEAKGIPTQAVVKMLVRKPGLKDTNFQVLKAKIDIVKYLAENCVFSTTTADCCINDISEKFGDPKNGAVVCETMTAIAEATSLAHVSSQVVDFAFNQKNPKVMQEVLLWLSTAIKEFGFASLNAKLFIENTKKALASSNPAVRQSAITFLGTLYLYMGPNLNMFFEDEKPALRDQISNEFVKFDGEKPPAPTRGITKSASSNSVDAVENNEDFEIEAPTVNVQDIFPRVDISSQITESLLTELGDKNWKVRNEALTKINSIIQEAKLIKPNIGDLPQALVPRLNDSNTKIAQAALNICEAIAKAMGPPCKNLIRVLFPAFLQGLGDSKTWIRTAAIDTINSFAEQCGYKEFFEGEMVGDALKSGSPTLRSELWTWLSIALPKIPVKSIPKEEVLVMVPHLFSNLEDRNADVRKNVQEAILGIMIHLSFESLVKQTEKLKPGSRTVVITALEKVRPNLPVKPLPKKPLPEKEEKVVRGTKPVANSKNAVKTKVSLPAKQAVSSRKKEEDIDTSPLLVVNGMKNQRFIDESKLKVLKWNFTTPREEFVELLRDQMNSANVNKTLIANMFHSDFRYHLKAIESLMDDLPDNSQALMSNLDLILKWLTLRFFDTNPSVLLKGLEYLHSVFNMLIENKYHMVDNEASSFLPYLVLKIGDPKDAVRNGVRSLFRQICDIYAISKLFTYVMEGIKSKNARQRAECLEVLSSIIEDYGISICLPTPAACLKEVAKQISDRDNSVRSAALNCIVHAYNIVGEKVYKMVGNISDKDMSLLEERIKRASRKTISKPLKVEHNATVTIPVSPQKEPAPVEVRNNISNHEDDEEEPDDEDNLPPVTLPPQLVPERKHTDEEFTGPFRLDPEYMKSTVTEFSELKLQKFDLNFLNEDIKVPTLSDTRANVVPLSPLKPILTTDTVSRLTFTKDFSTSKHNQPLLEKSINMMSSADSEIALKAIIELQDYLQSPRTNFMVDYEDQFMIGFISQLKILAPEDPVSDYMVSNLYKSIFTLMDIFYHNKNLGKQVSVPVIKGVMFELVSILTEKKLETCQNGEAFVRLVNLLCVKIIEKSDHTKVICALVILIQDCIREEQCSRLTELVMKCLWRVIKIMPTWPEDSIYYEVVLLHVHNFLKEFPSSWWKTKPSDTPLRTIKTILHSAVKIKGGSIMLYLSKIPNTSESEVESYLLKLLKTLKLEEVKGVPLKTELTSKKVLSRQNHNMLTDIFQKIGIKTETKEGLNLLYDFIQQHPEADIEPFLEKSSKFFQNYIKNGLQEIEESRKNSKSTFEKVEEKVASTITPTEAPVSEDNHGPEYWRHRLNMWHNLYETAGKN